MALHPKRAPTRPSLNSILYSPLTGVLWRLTASTFQRVPSKLRASAAMLVHAAQARNPMAVLQAAATIESSPVDRHLDLVGIGSVAHSVAALAVNDVHVDPWSL